MEMLGKQQLMVSITELPKQKTGLSMSLLEQFLTSVTLGNGVVIPLLLPTMLQLIGQPELSDAEEPLFSEV